MPIDFSNVVYQVCQEAFSVPCTAHLTFSRPDVPSFPARGIYDTRQLDIVSEDGAIYSDQQTIFDIRIAEWQFLPQQKDHIVIPRDCNGVELGEFEILDTSYNAGGQLTLILRRVEESQGPRRW